MNPTFEPTVTALQPTQEPVIATNETYTSNPFLNSVNGILLVLKLNPVASLLTSLVGFVGIGIAYAIYFAILFSSFASQGSTSISPALIVAAYVFGTVFFVLLDGAYFIVAAFSYRGQKITTKDAFATAVKRYIPFLALNILATIMLAIAFAVFIIPGVYLLGRLSLAPLVFFEEELGPIAAIKRSFSLTKGHVNEMLGALAASIFLAGGGYGLLLGATIVAPIAGRYQDLKMLQETGATKPKTHWLNYVYIVAAIPIIGIFGLLIYTTYTGIQHKAYDTSQATSQTQQINNTNTYR
jgi:hypothetical protein